MSLGIKGNSQLFEVERNTENNFAKQNNTTEKKKNQDKTARVRLFYFYFYKGEIDVSNTKLSRSIFLHSRKTAM